MTPKSGLKSILATAAINTPSLQPAHSHLAITIEEAFLMNAEYINHTNIRLVMRVGSQVKYCHPRATLFVENYHFNEQSGCGNILKFDFPTISFVLPTDMDCTAASASISIEHVTPGTRRGVYLNPCVLASASIGYYDRFLGQYDLSADGICLGELHAVMETMEKGYVTDSASEVSSVDSRMSKLLPSPGFVSTRHIHRPAGIITPLSISIRTPKTTRSFQGTPMTARSIPGTPLVASEIRSEIPVALSEPQVRRNSANSAFWTTAALLTLQYTLLFLPVFLLLLTSGPDETGETFPDIPTGMSTELVVQEQVTPNDNILSDDSAGLLLSQAEGVHVHSGLAHTSIAWGEHFACCM
jgi:hypothetical protein